MKKKSQSYSKSYFPLVLWAEDLNEIVSLLKARSDRIEIETKDHSFDSIQEASEYFGLRPQTELKIASYLPYATVDLRYFSASVWVDGGREDAAGLFYEINKVLSGRQRWIPFVYSYWVTFGVVGANFFVPTLLEKYAHIPGYASATVALAWIIWANYINTLRHSVVHFERRASARPFFQRNKDQLVVAIVAAVIGALLGAAGAKFFDKLASSGEKAPATTTQK